MKRKYIYFIIIFLIIITFSFYKPKEKVKWETEEFKNISYTHYNNDIKINNKNNYLTTYKFEVTNKKNKIVNYNLKIFQDNNELLYLKNKDVYISLMKNNKYIIGNKKGILLSELEGFKKNDSLGLHVLENNTLTKNETDIYILKIWSTKKNKNNEIYKLQTEIIEIENKLVNVELVNDLEKINITIDTNGKYLLPEPFKDGYTFTGWFTSDNKLVTNDTYYKDIKKKKLYAKFQKIEEIKEEKVEQIVKHKLTIKYENGTSDKIYEYYPLEIINLEKPTKEHYTFMGFEIIGSDAYIIDNKLFMGSSDTIIRARWKLNKYNYIVNHYIEKLDGTYELKNKDIIKADYNSKINAKTIDYNGFTSPSIDSIVISDNEEENIIDYYYRRNYYTLTINPNGGTTNNDLNYNLLYEEEITLSDAYKYGYTFKKWDKIDDNKFKMGASNIALNALYDANKYKVSFDYGNIDDIYVTYNSLYGFLKVPEKDGHTFKGWYLGDNLIKEDTIMDLASDHTLTAKWDINKYTLTLDLDGGNLSNINYELDYNSKVNLDIPTKEGYDFKGWEIVSGNGNIENNSYTMGSKNSVIKAKWEIKKFNVILNHGYDNKTESKEYEYNSTYGNINEPTRKGYTFLGWYLGSTLVTPEMKITNTNHELIAHWEIKYHSLTIDPNGGTLDMELSYVLAYNEQLQLKLPSLENKQLNKWNIIGDGKISDDNLVFTMGDSDVIITADYIPKKYLVHFDCDNIPDIEVSHGGTYGNLPKPVKEGYTFAGWYKNNTFSTSSKVDNDTLIENGEHTLYTYWVGITNTYLTNKTDDSVKVKIDYSGGLGTLKFHYSYDGGSETSRGSGNTNMNEFNFTNLDKNTTYNVSIYYEDTRGIKSPLINRTLKAITLTNLIEKYDMESSTENILTKEVTLEKDHIYYAFGNISSESDINGYFGVYNDDISLIGLKISTNNKKIGSSFKAPKDGTYTYQIFNNNTNKVTFNSLGLIDITEIYNNQNDEWMNKNINYFEGSSLEYYLY